MDAKARTPETALHAHGADDVLRALESSAAGLSEAQARERLARFGPNRLPERGRRSALARFLRQFHNMLVYLLGGAALVMALLAHWLDAGVIAAIVLINAVIGYVQENKAERALAAIRDMLSPQARVRRDGRVTTLGAEHLVPGDVVLVESGDRVPADARLLQAKNLRVDEAALTGESVPAEKRVEVAAADAAVSDRHNMIHAGTFVATGRSQAVVVATGTATELGRISTLLAGVQALQTPLLRKLAVFSRRASLLVLAIAALAFALGVGLRDEPVVDMFMAAVGLAVAAIPEGLPAIVTITLAIGVRRMAQRNAIVRRLPAIEALGSVTVIFTDKTGTLTRNEMTVQSVVTGAERYRVSGVGYVPAGEFLVGERAVHASSERDLLELLRAGLRCNDAELRQTHGGWTIAGDPTEGALLVAAAKAGLEAREEIARAPRLDVIPFEPELGLMATLHAAPDTGRVIYVKGAPERILERCVRERRAAVDAPLDEAFWRARTDDLARGGERVLACAMKHAGPADELQPSDIATGLTLLGLIGMVDPPRTEAIRAVAACRTAGIRVKMITGDHAATATAIATRVGIGNSRAVVGQELAKADAARLRDIAVTNDVYARVSPEQKLRLVEALQARGDIVAMTGDGVNDAPALKRADIGVAMGVAGTEVAKESAAIVLADDNFASIEAAVEEGRTAYDNLRKTLLFLMPTNAGEAFLIITALALGVTLPILPMQILWVNLVTEVALALALAFEPPEADIMRRPPRDPRAPIFGAYFLWRTALVTAVLVAGTLGLFAWEELRTGSLELARTAAVNTLVMFQVFYLLNSRFLIAPAWPWRALRGNRYVPLSMAAVVLLQVLYTHAPLMQVAFQTAALDAGAWARVLGVAFSIYVIVELEKWLVRRTGRDASVLQSRSYPMDSSVLRQ